VGNSMLFDSGEGHFWAYFTALLFAPINKSVVDDAFYVLIGVIVSVFTQSFGEESAQRKYVF